MGRRRHRHPGHGTRRSSRRGRLVLLRRPLRRPGVRPPRGRADRARRRLRRGLDRGRRVVAGRRGPRAVDPAPRAGRPPAVPVPPARCAASRHPPVPRARAVHRVLGVRVALRPPGRHRRRRTALPAVRRAGPGRADRRSTAAGPVGVATGLVDRARHAWVPPDCCSGRGGPPPGSGWPRSGSRSGCRCCSPRSSRPPWQPHPRRSGARPSGTFSLFFDTAGGIAPPLLGIVVALASYRLAFAMSGVVALVGLFLVARMSTGRSDDTGSTSPDLRTTA